MHEEVFMSAQCTLTIDLLYLAITCFRHEFRHITWVVEFEVSLPYNHQ